MPNLKNKDKKLNNIQMKLKIKGGWVLQSKRRKMINYMTKM